MKPAPTQSTPKASFSFSWPIALLTVGLTLIGASFLPVGSWVAQSQWTEEDAKTMDRISTEYKHAVFESPAEAGVSEQELNSQRETMRNRLDALKNKLELAKSQPQRWKTYLLGAGVLATAAGFFTYAKRNS